MSEEFTGYTVSFRPGGKDYDSPLVVVRANTIGELLDKLDTDTPEADDLAGAVYEFDQLLREDYRTDAGKVVTFPRSGGYPDVTAVSGDTITISTPPIWKAVEPDAPGLLTPNADGTYPPCPHGKKPRKVWTSPRNGKKYLFCAKDKGDPGACESIVIP